MELVIKQLVIQKILDNTAAENGGGIFVQGTGNVTIDKGVILGNTAGVSGGGLFNIMAIPVTLNKTKIIDNFSIKDPNFSGLVTVT